MSYRAALHHFVLGHVVYETRLYVVRWIGCDPVYSPARAYDVNHAMHIIQTIVYSKLSMHSAHGDDNTDD